MDKVIHTIGYSAFSDINEFLRQLQEHNIDVLIDVRSSPISSEYWKQYSIDSLEPFLTRNHIRYRNYAREFGARQENTAYYPNGYLDFDKFIQSDAFQSGISKIQQGIDMGYKFSLMCAEKDPISCHRTIMVAKGFKQNGFAIKHIMANGEIQTQEDIEKRLVDMYLQERNQLNLFENKTNEEYIEEAYKKQNQKIGYKKEEEQE